MLGELLDRKKAVGDVLDALCLATLARFPTETERQLILDGVKAQPNRRATWHGVLTALAATDEAKAHAAELAKRSSP